MAGESEVSSRSVTVCSGLEAQPGKGDAEVALGDRVDKIDGKGDGGKERCGGVEVKGRREWMEVREAVETSSVAVTVAPGLLRCTCRTREVARR